MLSEFERIINNSNNIRSQEMVAKDYQKTIERNMERVVSEQVGGIWVLEH